MANYECSGPSCPKYVERLAQSSYDGAEDYYRLMCEGVGDSAQRSGEVTPACPLSTETSVLIGRAVTALRAPQDLPVNGPRMLV